MGQPRESIRPGKGCHFLMKQSIFAGAGKNRQVGIVNDTHSGTIAPEPERFVEETFHLEPVEMGVKPYVTQLGKPQVQAACDDCHSPVAYA